MSRVPSSPSSTVVVTVNGSHINQGDIEEHTKNWLVLLRKQYENQRDRIFEIALQGLIEDELIRVEAESRRLSPQALLELEIAGKIEPVTSADVEQWFLAKPNRARDAAKPSARSRAKEELTRKRLIARHGELMEELRKKIPHRVLLEPARVSLDPTGAPFRGNPNAPVTITVFSDFECPFCGDLVLPMHQLEETYGDQIKIAFRQFPLQETHAKALLAAEASLCAMDQGRFWAMHDALFANQSTLDEEDLRRIALDIGLDPEQFGNCLSSREKTAVVLADIALGDAAGVSGTPTVYVNGRRVPFARGTPKHEPMAALIEDELRRQAERPLLAGQGNQAGIAVVADRRINREQLEKRAAAMLTPLQQRYQQKRTEILASAREELIEQSLLQAEAHAQGTSPDELLAARIDAKVQPVSAAEVSRFVQANPRRFGGVNGSRSREQARRFLMEQRKKPHRMALMQQLRKKYPVRYLD